MKANSLNKMNSVNTWRRIVLVLGIVSLFGLVVTAGSAQLKNQKRVTGLQLGDAAGGSRVTIASDSPMSDYEAFRRGDRFYVKIPVATFAGASPDLRGNGFEDIRVETVGGSVVVSFRLQPGATARVDQRANRLDVIFSSVGVGLNPGGTTASNVYPTSRKRRAGFSSGFNSDASAGPVPPMSSSSSPQSIRNSYRPAAPARNNGSTATSLNVVPNRSNRSTRPSSTVNSGNQNAPRSSAISKAAPGTARSYPALPNATGGTSAASRSPSTSRGSASTSTSAPTPTPTPTVTPTPWTSTAPGATASPTWNAQTGTTAPTVYPTPANPYAQRPVSTPFPIASSTAESTWDRRMKTVKAWADSNRNALIVAGLISLAVLVGLGIWASKRRKRGSLATSNKKTGKVVREKVMGHPVVEEEPFRESPIASAPVATAAAASSGVQGNTRVQQAPTFKKATAQEHREVAQDREVFEL